ncbi:MAG: glycosyltransferase family 4 protein [Pseudomonadota bacterium]|nr:glycosyltransferase family 4 protein [Pseudomonadota bacterium]
MGKRILMFGWEFPPLVSGGLGTACHGITRALAELGHRLIFVMPHGEGLAAFPGLTIVSASAVLAASATARSIGPAAGEGRDPCPTRLFLHPYLTVRPPKDDAPIFREWPADSLLAHAGGYGVDLFAEVGRYARAGEILAARTSFDVIHGHDWMAVPACLAARRVSGRPFVLHVHSLEYDRSGEGLNDEIRAWERRGLEGADRVIAVSNYTKEMIVRHYGIAREKIAVAHNAVSAAEGRRVYRVPAADGEKRVLFLGRITYQKGPEYFVEAAARVLEEMPETVFIMAGSGDMMAEMVEKVAALKIGRRFHFTGFLQGRQVEEAFAAADLYVMPSVSEPFGLTPLEAMMYDVPVIVSRQSGVAEILKHAVKVDFWDVAALAEKMISILKYPPMAGELAARGREELRGLSWQTTARKIVAVYDSL